MAVIGPVGYDPDLISNYLRKTNLMYEEQVAA